MTHETENERLLELAEFKKHFFPNTGLTLWVAPDGSCLDEAPNFFHPVYGLGWLFKYVVPKIPQHIELEFERYYLDGQLWYYWGLYEVDKHQVILNSFEARNKEPQVALANTILKWLDSK